jgi:hypothetical protein
MSFDYVLRVDGGDECSVSRDKALTERQVIESPLGSVVVDLIESHPANGTPGRASCHPFAPIHSTT